MVRTNGVANLLELLHIKKTAKKKFHDHIMQFVDTNYGNSYRDNNTRSNAEQSVYLKEICRGYLDNEVSHEFFPPTDSGGWRYEDGTKNDYAANLRTLVQYWIDHDARSIVKKTTPKPKSSTSDLRNAASKLTSSKEKSYSSVLSLVDTPSKRVLMIPDDMSDSSPSPVPESSTKHHRATMTFIEDQDEDDDGDPPDIPYEAENIDDHTSELPDLSEIYTSNTHTAVKPKTSHFVEAPAVMTTALETTGSSPHHTPRAESSVAQRAVDKGKRRGENIDEERPDGGNFTQPMNKKARYEERRSGSVREHVSIVPISQAPFTTDSDLQIATSPTTSQTSPPVFLTPRTNPARLVREQSMTTRFVSIEKGILEYIRECYQANLAQVDRATGSAEKTRQYKHSAFLLGVLESDLSARFNAISNGNTINWSDSKCLWYISEGS